MTRIPSIVLLMLIVFSGAAWAERLAVVDVERIFRESAPGKAGEAHLEQAREILQKGMDELQALYKGAENTPEAEAALREGQMILERQLAAERQAVRQVLTATLEKATKAWFAAANARRNTISAVAPANVFFAYSPPLDVTDAVMQEMDKEKPVFHTLPTVTIRAKHAADSAQAPQPGPPQQAQASPEAGSGTSKAEKSGREPLQEGEKRHVVQSGDTLRKIATRYKVSPEAIMHRNKLTSPNHIVEGRALIIPVSGQ